MLATQYRGVDGGDFGTTGDEFGGAEVHDVLNLIPLARALGFVRPRQRLPARRVARRHGDLPALKSGLAVNAAAVVSGEADLAAGGRSRPEMLGVYRELIPGLPAARPRAAARPLGRRLAEKINTPVLILHGTADWRTSPPRQRARRRRQAPGPGQDLQPDPLRRRQPWPSLRLAGPRRAHPRMVPALPEVTWRSESILPDGPRGENHRESEIPP